MNRRQIQSQSRKTDVFINTKTDLAAQFQKCVDLINSDDGEVYLHCMGKAVNLGINLMMRLINQFPRCQAEVNTSTIKLKDDAYPIQDDDDFTVHKRLNSCLHIHIFRVSNRLESVS